MRFFTLGLRNQQAFAGADILLVERDVHFALVAGGARHRDLVAQG